MARNTVRVVAHMIARPETIGAVREVLSRLLEPTRRETGCIAYELFENPGDPTDLTFIEEWTDDASLDAHLATPFLHGVVAEAAALLAAPPDVRRYRLVG